MSLADPVFQRPVSAYPVSTLLPLKQQCAVRYPPLTLEAPRDVYSLDPLGRRGPDASTASIQANQVVCGTVADAIRDPQRSSPSLSARLVSRSATRAHPSHPFAPATRPLTPFPSIQHQLLGALLPRARPRPRRPRHQRGPGQAELERRLLDLLLRDGLGQVRAPLHLRRPRALGRRRGASLPFACLRRLRVPKADTLSRLLGPHRRVPPALPPGDPHQRQGGCGQQLRPWSLHCASLYPVREVTRRERTILTSGSPSPGRQGAHRHDLRPHPQARRQLQRSPGLLRLPLVRWRHGLWLRRAPPREALGRLRQEEQARVLGLPGSVALVFGRRAVQLDPHDPHHPRARRLLVHG